MERFRQDITPIDLRADYGELGKVEYTGFEFETGDKKWLLHWENTTIKTYSNEIYNHIEVIDDDGTKYTLKDEEQTLMIILWEHDYPHEYRPMPEQDTHESTVEIVTEIGSLALEEYLEDIGNL